MADNALTNITTLDERAAVVRRHGFGDLRFHYITQLAAFSVLVIFGGVMISLGIGAWPAITTFGWKFLYTEIWNPVTDQFGALGSIYGTILTSVIAMAVSVPIGIGIAIFLTEICPRPLRRPIGIAIELLAGIPSIIYGIWGLFVFAPAFQENVETWFINATGAGDTSTVEGSGWLLHSILVPLGWAIEQICTAVPGSATSSAGRPTASASSPPR